MLSQLSKTLSTNVAIGGLALLVLGGGGAGASLAASNSPAPKPDKTVEVKDTETEKTDDEKTEDANAEDAEDEGTRPTDTHGYCVSQVAKAEHSAPTGSGPDKVTHGSLVSAAAHACGKQVKTARTGRSEKAPKAEKTAKTNQDKAYGRGHGTGRPSTVTPGTAPSS